MAKQHLLLSLAILFMVSSQAQCLLHGSGAQSQPPSVMGAHIHGKGDLMFSYVATHMEMNGVQRGTEPLSEKQVANRYMMYGTTMQMPMHMIMAMYGISNKLNVMVMGHYMSCNMTMVHAMGSFREEMVSSVNGLGDTRITGIYDLWSSSTQHALLQGGISLPTGNIENRGDMGMNPHAKLGYAMQFGSGTYDLLASMAYTKTSPLWSFGAQPGLVVRNGINSQGYALGNQYYTNIWLGFTPIKSTFLGSKMYLASFGSVRGMDKEMSTWSAGGDPTNTGHERINVSLYLTYAPEKLKGMSFQAEYEHPVVENVTGIQMTLKKTMYFSAKYTL